VYTCDYDEADPQNPSYLDYYSGWERNGSELISGDETRFGNKVIKVVNNYGPTCDLLPVAHKNYIFSAWVKIKAGTSAFLNVEYRDAKEPANLSKWPIVCGCNSDPDLADDIYNSDYLGITAAEAAEWKYVELKVNAAAKVNAAKHTYLRAYVGNAGVSGSVAYFTDIRFYPEKSLVSTSFYDQELGVPVAIVDANNKAKYFTYDRFGRLASVINNGGQILKDAVYGNNSVAGRYIDITFPSLFNLGWIFKVGETYTIRWRSSNVQTVSVFYSLDKVNWLPIATSIPNSGACEWTISMNFASVTHCWLKVSDDENQTLIYDITDFQIFFTTIRTFIQKYIMNLF
jgi:YD repeat-containing protein